MTAMTPMTTTQWLRLVSLSLIPTSNVAVGKWRGRGANRTAGSLDGIHHTLTAFHYMQQQYGSRNSGAEPTLPNLKELKTRPSLYKGKVWEKIMLNSSGSPLAKPRLTTEFHTIQLDIDSFFLQEGKLHCRPECIVGATIWKALMGFGSFFFVW